MQFTELFIRRPVLSVVVSLLIFLIGLISFKQLPIREFPKADASTVTISTDYPGASSSLVESFISQPIEDAVSGVDNVDYITSTSTEGESKVTINLKLNADVNQAMLDIQSKLSSVLKKLPSGVDNPIIKKDDPDATPVMIITFADPHQSQEATTDFLNRTIVPLLSNVTGVSEATIFGKRSYAIRIWLDPKSMAAHNISPKEVSDALEANNLQTQAGEIDQQNQVISVNANTDLHSVQQFNQLIIKRDNNQAVRLQDIGYAVLGASDDTTSLNINGQAGVGIGIIAKSNANPLDVSKAVNQTLEEIKSQLPEGMHLLVARDSSLYINQSIHEVKQTIVEACLCVVLVIFLFLGSFRSVLIPLVTIPLSLIGTCVFMLMMGYTLNLLTLLAVVLAVGMVVDDAIVVLENIHRHIEAGLSPISAAIKGASEIRFAIIAMTFTLAAVYTPIGFSTGLTGTLFREFAFTLAATVVISGVVALILTPMMCSRMYQPNVGRKNSFIQQIETIFHRMSLGYEKLLIQLLKQRLSLVVILITILATGMIFLIPLMKQSMLAPREDQGVVIAMQNGPTASNIKYTEHYSSQLGTIFNQLPEQQSYVIINGRSDQSSSQAFLSLKPWNQRKKSADEIISELNSKVQDIAGVKTMLLNPPSLPTSNNNFPVELNIKTSGSYQELARVVNQFIQQAEKNPNIVALQSKLELNKPELSLQIDRNKANDLGIAMSDVSDALRIGLGQPTITEYIKDGLTYDVILQFLKQDRSNPDQLNNINVKTSSGKMMPLANILKIQNVIAPTSLLHFEGQRSATIDVVLQPSFSTGAAVNYFLDLAKQVLPSHMSLAFSGESRQLLQENGSMLQIFVFAIIFIYLVLAAQFESFLDPLIVMLSVPLSLAGALAALFVTASSLNIYTEIGLVTLIGLITKHGILIVTFANQRRSEGYSIENAVIQAATIRLRPILMTTAAMIMGAVPLALASGAGAVARQQIGFAIIGGMGFGTLFTLFMVPFCYILLNNLKQASCHISKLRQRFRGGL